MNIPNVLLYLSKNYKFPLSVQSTSIQLYHKLSFNISSRDKAYLCFILALKFENIHSEISFLAKKLQNFNEELILGLEIEAFEQLNFDFNFVDFYSKMIGKMLVYNLSDFSRFERRLDKILVNVNFVDLITDKSSIDKLIDSAIGITTEFDDLIKNTKLLPQEEIIGFLLDK